VEILYSIMITKQKQPLKSFSSKIISFLHENETLFFGKE